MNLTSSDDMRSQRNYGLGVTSWRLALITIVACATAAGDTSLYAQKVTESQVRQWWQENRLQPTEVGKNHELVKKAFRTAIRSANKATVRIYKGDRLVCMGTIVDPSGYIVTKSSEVNGNVTARITGGGRHNASVVSVDDTNDVTMLKIDAGTLPYVRLVASQPSVGAWIASPGGLSADPLAIGVVSVAARPIEQQAGALGIFIDDSDKGPLVGEVFDGSAAKRAGIRENDIITAIDDQPVAKREELIARIRDMRPGDRVRVKFIRDGESQSVTATLSRRMDLDMAGDVGLQEDITGPLSVRRSGFLSVIQHDSLLRPNQCGGPVVDLKGRVIGINIARADRVSTYALTADVILPWIDALKSGTKLTSNTQ